ncbi:hypothetical protein CLOLEP_01529 [[Clostridium] leptum DSM 753]|uniref:Uncharacterized protein n=1 Tax=[Clostridium] leptum DSM 753 TaxID=428125 RepID=A7VSI8_9FIRM|nr:hypothetical protein CLOLEP_01529 [[Clostridium] leptum DSM 753]
MIFDHTRLRKPLIKLFSVHLKNIQFLFIFFGKNK